MVKQLEKGPHTAVASSLQAHFRLAGMNLDEVAVGSIPARFSGQRRANEGPIAPPTRWGRCTPCPPHAAPHACPRTPLPAVPPARRTPCRDPHRDPHLHPHGTYPGRRTALSFAAGALIRRGRSHSPRALSFAAGRRLSFRCRAPSLGYRTATSRASRCSLWDWTPARPLTANKPSRQLSISPSGPDDPPRPVTGR
jgi:hypothetical protein